MYIKTLESKIFYPIVASKCTQSWRDSFCISSYKIKIDGEDLNDFKVLKFIFLGDGGEMAPPSPKKESRDLAQLKKRVESLETENQKLEERVQAIVAENFTSVDEQTRKIFELSQAQHFEDRKDRDDKIRRLEGNYVVQIQFVI